MPSAKLKETVLLVEDEVLVRMFGADMLEDAGYIVIEAESADAALSVLAADSGIDLLLSDVDMPGSMDGVELARLVHQRWPSVRILLTSGHHRLAEDGLPEGSRFIRKPWTSLSLVEKVQSVLIP